MLTRLVGVANRFFEIRDVKANSELTVCAGGGIPKITLGITGLYKIVSELRNWNPLSNLSKTHRYCCQALVHFHFSAFSSIFPLNWTAKQSVVFFSQNQFSTREEPFLWELSRSWPTWKSAGCLGLMPDSSDPYRYFGIVNKKLKVTRGRTKIHYMNNYRKSSIKPPPPPPPLKYSQIRPLSLIRPPFSVEESYKHPAPPIIILR